MGVVAAGPGVTARAAVAGMPQYRPGRSPADVHGRPLPDELVRLASNESPFGPLPEVLRTIEEGLAGINRYPDPRGAALRARLADSLEVPVDWVTVGPGSVGLLWQLAEVFLEPGTELVTPWPSFEGYPIVTALMGARLSGVELVDGAVQPDRVIAAIGERTRLVVLAEPNNPTGRAAGFHVAERLAAATANRCVMVLDEAYVEFAGPSASRRSMDLVRRHPHVVVLRTFSKAHGLAGVRVGYAVANPAIIELLDRVAPPFAVSSVAQAAAVASLDAAQAMAERVAAVAAERERVGAALQSLGVAVWPSATNFVFLPCAMPEVLASGLERAGVITRPVAGFGLRVTIGSPADNDRFIAALSDEVAAE